MYVNGIRKVLVVNVDRNEGIETAMDISRHYNSVPFVCDYGNYQRLKGEDVLVISLHTDVFCDATFDHDKAIHNILKLDRCVNEFYNCDMSRIHTIIVTTPIRKELWFRNSPHGAASKYILDVFESEEFYG